MEQLGERRIKAHDISTSSHQCSTLATLSLKGEIAGLGIAAYAL